MKLENEQNKFLIVYAWCWFMKRCIAKNVKEKIKMIQIEGM